MEEGKQPYKLYRFEIEDSPIVVEYGDWTDDDGSDDWRFSDHDPSIDNEQSNDSSDPVRREGDNLNQVDIISEPVEEYPSEKSPERNHVDAHIVFVGDEDESDPIPSGPVHLTPVSEFVEVSLESSSEDEVLDVDSQRTPNDLDEPGEGEGGTGGEDATYNEPREGSHVDILPNQVCRDWIRHCALHSLDSTEGRELYMEAVLLLDEIKDNPIGLGKGELFVDARFVLTVLETATSFFLLLADQLKEKSC